MPHQISSTKHVTFNIETCKTFRIIMPSSCNHIILMFHQKIDHYIIMSICISQLRVYPEATICVLTSMSTDTHWPGVLNELIEVNISLLNKWQ